MGALWQGLNSVRAGERREAAHAAKRVKATRNQFSTIKESIYLTELANWRLTAGAAALGSVRFGFVATRLQLRLRLQLQVGQAAVARRVLLCEHVLWWPAPLAGCTLVSALTISTSIYKRLVHKY